MSNVLGIAIIALVAAGYVAAGMLTAVVYGIATDSDTNNWAKATRIVAGWPIIVFTALTGLYALWATQRELDKL